MKKRFISTLLVAITTIGALTGCGSSNSNVAQAATETTTEADTAEATTEEAPAGEPIELKIGVVGSIYEDLWENAVETLKDEGIDLKIVQFSDYVTPNNALANGEIDLNAFQHQIYLQSEIDQYGYELTNIGNTFIIPLNLYSEKIKSVDELKAGDTIAGSVMHYFCTINLTQKSYKKNGI